MVRQALVIHTGTAALAVFDPSLLDHRRTDYADWWSDPDEELAELARGNVLIVALGSDGSYAVTVDAPAPPVQGAVTARVASTGRLFIGPGEELPGQHSEPGTALGGRFLEVAAGTLQVGFSLLGPGQVAITLLPVHGPASNPAEQPLELL